MFASFFQSLFFMFFFHVLLFIFHVFSIVFRCKFFFSFVIVFLFNVLKYWVLTGTYGDTSVGLLWPRNNSSNSG